MTGLNSNSMSLDRGNDKQKGGEDNHHWFKRKKETHLDPDWFNDRKITEWEQQQEIKKTMESDNIVDQRLINMFQE